MSSAVVDGDMYKSGQQFERFTCNDEVLCKVFKLWWKEAVLVEDFLHVKGKNDRIGETDSLRTKAPKHYWRWDKIGLDHTDPQKVANAMETLFDCGFITDRDIQETHFNRDVDDWRDETQGRPRIPSRTWHRRPGSTRRSKLFNTGAWAGRSRWRSLRWSGSP